MFVRKGRKVCRWKSARSDQGEKLEYSTGGVFWEMCTIWESLHEGLTYRASLSLVLGREKSMEESGRTRSSLHIIFAEKCQQTSRCACPACQAGLSEGPCIKRWLCTRVGLIHWPRSYNWTFNMIKVLCWTQMKNTYRQVKKVSSYHKV